MNKPTREVPVRIVVKKEKTRERGHGGAWKVAYADFVTAMMALFIVLWIVSQQDALKKDISQYFIDPVNFRQNISALEKAKMRVVFVKEPPRDEKKILEDKFREEMKRLREEAARIEDKIISKPEFKKYKDNISVAVSDEGLRIELTEKSSGSGLFFDIGSAKLKPHTEKILKTVASEVGKMPNDVILEGHTDSKPYIHSGYTNWELSADRANAARKILENYSVNKKQIVEVRGYADTRLKHPDKPYDFSNRRISILIVPVSKYFLEHKLLEGVDKTE